MIYMMIFWTIILFNLGYYYIKKGHLNQKVRDNAIIFTLLATAFLIVSIATKDPIFSAFGVPNEFEWVVGLFIAGLTSWKLYFGPMKNRIIHLEKQSSYTRAEIRYIKEGLGSIRSDLNIIKEKLIS